MQTFLFWNGYAFLLTSTPSYIIMILLLFGAILKNLYAIEYITLEASVNKLEKRTAVNQVIYSFFAHLVKTLCCIWFQNVRNLFLLFFLKKRILVFGSFSINKYKLYP